MHGILTLKIARRPQITGDEWAELAAARSDGTLVSVVRIFDIDPSTHDAVVVRRLLAQAVEQAQEDVPA